MTVERPPRFRDLPAVTIDRRVLAAVMLAKLVLHLPGLVRYGYFRDELYFLDCGRHLGFGYVDHAPLVGLYAKLALLLGGSLPALRVIALAAGLGTVAITVALTAQLGGRRWAQGLAGLAFVVAPINLSIASILSMNVFEPLFWMGGVLVLVRLIRTGDSRLWLWFGLLVGLGLENKHSTAFFGVAAALAVVSTPLRRELRKPWIWLGAVLALLVFLPNLMWQWQHGFPTLVDLSNVRAIGKNVELAPLAFLAQQTLVMHPLLLPLWLGGLAALLIGPLRRFRALAVVYLTLLATMLLLHGKDYYLAPAYPMLLAAGAVALEGWLARHPDRRWPTVARVATLLVVVVGGAVTAPLALPLLDPPAFLAYGEALGIHPQKAEVAHEGPLPQLWGDQFGWPELVADVAAVYHSLPPAERSRTAIYASNYGEAGALNLLGPAHDLPAPVCAHQTHSLWGPPAREPETVIWLQWRPEWLTDICGSVEVARDHHHPWGMAEENRPILVCRELKQSLAELWPEITHWN